MHAADGEDDILGADAMQPRDGPAKPRIALGAGVTKREVVQIRWFARSICRPQQLRDAKIRPEAFAEIVTRRRADQRDDLAFQKSRHWTSVI